jgi:hypothetical protein
MEEKNKILLLSGIIIIGILIFILSFFNFTITGLTISENSQSENSEALINFIIEITDGEHLDSNKNPISNIYNEIKQLDNIWSETIPPEDYVRITFEQNLTSENDITVYPRIIDGDPKIEVYTEDGTEVIAEFTNIRENQYNKVFLTNIIGEQDTFYLKILNGALQFDHIFDPDESEKNSIEEVKE